MVLEMADNAVALYVKVDNWVSSVPPPQTPHRRKKGSGGVTPPIVVLHSKMIMARNAVIGDFSRGSNSILKMH